MFINVFYWINIILIYYYCLQYYKKQLYSIKYIKYNQRYQRNTNMYSMGDLRRKDLCNFCSHTQVWEYFRKIKIR